MIFTIEKITVRGYQYHVQKWGDESLPKLFLLHGWMDCGASFKYMAAFLAESFHLIAPDLRGFGETSHTTESGYWFQDYLADFEVIINHYVPNLEEKVDTIGHSLGGNITFAYAGLRPNRIAKVMSMEGFGLPERMNLPMMVKLERFLDETTYPKETKTYQSRDELIRSIRAANPYLNDKCLDGLANLWAKNIGNDKFQLKHDHKHRFINPARYGAEDFNLFWSQITAQTGILYGNNKKHMERFGIETSLKQLQAAISLNPENVFVIEDAHHMMHIEKPEQSAAAIKAFMAS